MSPHGDPVEELTEDDAAVSPGNSRLGYVIFAVIVMTLGLGATLVLRDNAERDEQARQVREAQMRMELR